MSTIAEIPAEEWRTWLEDTGGIILDVREPDEWELGVLPDAVRMSMGDVVDRLEELDKGTPVVVVCRSGSRSLQVARYLDASGYEAANLAGGMKALGMQD